MIVSASSFADSGLSSTETLEPTPIDLLTKSDTGNTELFFWDLTPWYKESKNTLHDDIGHVLSLKMAFLSLAYLIWNDCG